MFTTDELQQIKGQYDAYRASLPQQKAAPKKKGNFLTSLIPSGGGIAGSAGGAALGTAILPGIGTIAGALLGGALGGGAGKVAENKIEGQSLGNGVAGEAITNGILGAGPLRLGKVGIDAVRGVKAGADLTSALTSAGKSAVNSSITKTVGKKLTSSGDDLLVKQFRLTPSQLKNFKSKYGEDVSQVIKRYGIKNVGDITKKGVEPLQSQYDNLVAGATKPISFDDFAKSVEKRANKLINSAAPDTQQSGLDLLDHLNSLRANYGKEGFKNGTALNKVKKDYDQLVNYTEKQANPGKYTVNKHIADSAREVLNAQHPKLGNTGQELSKLHQFRDNALKQEQLGRGNLPASLPALLGASAGGSVGGGPLGAIGGIAATKILNSSVGRRAAANGVIKAGENLTAKAASASPYGIKSIAGRVLPAGLLGSVGSQLSPNQDTTTATPTTTNPTTNANMDALSQTSGDLSSTSDPNSPFSPQNVESSVKQIISNGGTLKDATDFLSLADAIQKMQAPTQGAAGYSKPTASQYSQGVSGQQSVAQLQQLLQQDPSLLAKGNIPGQGLGVLGSLESGALGTSDYKAVTDNILNSIARINTGANMPVEEEAFYRKTYLPQPGDSDKTKQDKISNLQSFFNPITNYGGGSQSDSSDLASALLAQGGY